MDVGIEIFSLSKTYNMTGWRAGAVVGNADLVERLLAAQDEHRQRHVRGRPGGRRRRPALRPVVRGGDVRDLPAPPRRPGRRAAAHRPAGGPAEGRDLRLGPRARRRDLRLVHRAGARGGGRGDLARRGLRAERRGVRAHEPDGAGRAPQRGRRPHRRPRRRAEPVAPRPAGAAGCAPRRASPSAPTRATPASTWWPPRPATWPPGARVAVPTGIAVAIPPATPASCCRARASPAGTA